VSRRAALGGGLALATAGALAAAALAGHPAAGGFQVFLLVAFALLVGLSTAASP
jgi:hypothetical protein